MDGLRSRLSKGEVIVGPFCLIPHPVSVEVMGRAGFDFLLIDGEHAQFGRSEIENFVRAAEVAGTPLLFRFPGQDREWIAWALDAGAGGVVVPRIETVAQAQAAVDAARFPPLGKRGFGLSRAAGYGANLAAYRASANDDLLLVLMVETAEGLANIDAIAALPHVDAILIGVGDLASSIGAARLDDAIETIIQSCRRQRRTVGLAHATPDGIAPAITRGVALHVIGGDLSLLQKGAGQSAQSVRNAKETGGTHVPRG